MIKHINHQNFLTTPFVTAKSWHLSNTNPDDLVILEPTGSEDTVALEYTDYSTDDPFVNTECSIALEQQGEDRIKYQDAISGSGKFFPDQEATNQDGTYKRLVYTQTKSTFYNKYNDPTKIFGVEFIDFPLGQTFRDLSNKARLFNVPQAIFGDRIVENTVRLNDTSLDDNIEIWDDGHQNLVARHNLFSKVQEVKLFGNIIMSGSAAYTCYDDTVRASASDSGSQVSIGFLGGTIETELPLQELFSNTVGYYTGSYTLEIITGSAGFDSSSISTAFYTGSLVDNVIVTSGSADTGSIDIGYYTGSLITEIITSSLSGSSLVESTASVVIGFYTGSTILEVVTTASINTTSSVIVGFLSGSIA